MKRLTAILILIYFLFGTLCLPMGDFSSVMDLPKMYQHCKATEDTDMNFLDFITDHLINIDGLFDKHDNGDEQKPHQPFQFHYQSTQVNFISQSLKIESNECAFSNKNFILYSEDFYLSPYFSEIFHPPIV